MATATLTSARGETNTTHLRDPSFSSYLNGNEEPYVLKLPESKLKPFATNPRVLGRKNGEISVFGAEKYFNGVMDKEEIMIANEKVKKDEMKPTTQRGTPSTCSEVSWNSRSALLPVMQSRQEKGNNNGKNFFAALGCKCYCLDDKSVDVDENIIGNKNSKKEYICGEIHGKVMPKLPIEIKHDSLGLAQIKQTPPSSWYPSNKGGEDLFTIPISQSVKEEEEKARQSLEVFGSPVMNKEEIALSIEKRLAMLTWDANKKVEITNSTTNTPIPAVVIPGPDDDNDSDSSSDLFEIKSLSSTGHPFFKRQESDGLSVCMSPSSCYEPSEASIDWSVVTASAANFSVASDNDEFKSVGNVKKNDKQKSTTTSVKIDTSKNVTKRSPGMLLGCRSYKAVKVAAGAHKLPEKKPEFRGNQKTNSFTPRSRFQAESKVTDLESAHAQRAFAIGPFSQLHSPSVTDPIYMH